MGSTDNLKQGLSYSLQQELDKQLVSGETVLISLPGSMGEAFAVTDRRAFIIRERESGLTAGFDVHGYAINSIRGAEAVSSSTGGYIELKTERPLSDIETGRVYFPTYECEKYQAAAQYLNKKASETPPTAVSNAPTKAVASTGDVGSICPGCGAEISESAAFCGECGIQVAAICMTCGSACRPGSIYCSHCGCKLVEYPTKCGKCGEAIARWMTYCPECGAMLGQKCASCGVDILPGWNFCASCGRAPGTPISRGNFERLRGSLGSERNEESSTVSGNVESEAAKAEPANSSPTTAEDFNKRGQERFEAEDIEGAIKEFEMAVKLAPTNASYHCNLAVAYDENDNDELALAEYEKTLELDPNDLGALLCLGYMYNEDEQPEKAKNVWRRILEIAPDSPEAREVTENLQHQADI